MSTGADNLAPQFLSPPASSGNDVSTLFSHFAPFASNTKYRELVREEAALLAVHRWPLLAEIEGFSPAESGTVK